MPAILETDPNAIIQTARSRDVETGLGMWTLLRGQDAGQCSDTLIDALSKTTGSIHLKFLLADGKFVLDAVGDKLFDLAGDMIVGGTQPRLVPQLERKIHPVLERAARLSCPAYSKFYSENSPVVLEWEMLALPVGESPVSEIVCLMMPLQFRHNVFSTIVETNPVGICAGEIIRDDHGAVKDFRIYLVNEAACQIIGLDRRTILFAKVSDWFPKFSQGVLFKRLVQVVNGGAADRLEISLRRNGRRRSFTLSAVERLGNLVLSFTDVTELMDTKAALSARHKDLLKAHHDLKLQKEDLRVTAESLELARQALSAEVQRRAALERKLRTLAELDELSSLPNRRHFLDLARAEFQRSVRYGSGFALLMIDVDRFKAVNDTYGHAAGDMVIQSVAHACKAICREGLDISGRIGGEEFALLLPETSLQGGRDLGERIISHIAETETIYRGNPIRVTASIGVAEFKAGDESVSEIVQRADKALYSAKRAGRNQVAQFAA